MVEMLLSNDERALVLRVRREVMRIVRLVSRMEPREAEQAAGLAIDRFAAPLTDISPEFASVIAHHLSCEVRRLRTH